MHLLLVTSSDALVTSSELPLIILIIPHGFRNVPCDSLELLDAASELLVTVWGMHRASTTVASCCDHNWSKTPFVRLSCVGPSMRG